MKERTFNIKIDESGTVWLSNPKGLTIQEMGTVVERKLLSIMTKPLISHMTH